MRIYNPFKNRQLIGCLFLIVLFPVSATHAQNDTVRVMAYNVLHYGDGCQGSNQFLHSNIKTIVKYYNPDVLGLVKMQSIKLSTTDFSGYMKVGFADSVIVYETGK